MGRAPCCDKANVKKGPWSPEEDSTLKSFIEKNGTGGNWIALPQKIGLKRCGKSCRLRWLNYLRPNIKHGEFTEEEDNIICSLYISIGSRWSIIAAQLPGRTDNDIKNYWNTRLKKKLLGKRKQSNNQKDTNGILEDNTNNSYSNSLSSSALERLQLHMQLQTLQNPFSFYNNNPTVLWPKLHPSQEKMIQTSLQGLSHHNDNSNNNPMMQNAFTTNSLHVEQDGAKINRNPQVNILENINIPLNNNNNYDLMHSSSVLAPRGEAVEKSTNNEGIQQLQTELDDILNNRITTMSYNIPQEDDIRVAEFDCFRDMNSSKDHSLMWWSNDSDTKSGSSSSWDNSSNNHQVLLTEGMFQDYELGYSL